MRAADLTPVARDVAKLPASGGMMLLTIVAAYAISVLPWSGTWLLSRPDFVLLVLLFWSIHEPRSIGQGIAFTAGLLMDVSDSMLLGQHALAYVVAIYGAQILRVRILSFGLFEQTLHMLGLFIVASLVMLALNLLLGADFPGFAYFISPALAALAWGPTTILLYSQALRRRREASP
ncbi:MAG: rod shape-determining protein MreD [Bacillota bacterium]